LPGNPLSVLATFSRYVIPALSQMEGREYRTQFLTISGAHPAHEHLAMLLPVKASKDTCQIFSNSGNLISARGACGVVEIPPQNAMMPPSPDRAFYPYQFPSP
jgi:molybdopterin biosynthesis enzyme